MEKRNIKKAFLFFALALAFSSCGKNSPTSAQDDTLDRIRRTGQIDVCVVVDPPYVIKDAKSGALRGEYPDAVNLIAKKMNAKVNWHETTYGNTIADLESRRCDVAAAYFSALIPRALSIAYTTAPLAYSGDGVLVRKNDNRFSKIKGVFEFDKPDMKVTVASGETGDLFVRDNFKHAQVRKIDVQSSDISRFCVEVESGRADVAIGGINALEQYTKKHPELIVLFREHPFNLNPIEWAVRQDDIKWLHFLDTALQFLDTQGTLAALEKKYDIHQLHLVKQYKLQ